MINSQKSITISGDDIFHLMLKRQEKILSSSRLYFRNIILIALITSPLFFGVQVFTTILTERTLSGIISNLLFIFLALINLTLILLGLTFIPFVVFNSYLVSKKLSVNFRGSLFRWVQLILSTSVPVVIYLIAIYNSTVETTKIIQVKSIQDTVFLFTGSILTSILLYLLFSARLNLPLTLGVLNSLLLASLFLAHRQDYTVLSLSILFGILLYLTFSFGQIEKIMRQTVIYDFDPKTISEISRISERQEELQVTMDEITLSERELEIKKSQQVIKINLMEAELAKRKDEQQDEVDHMEMELKKRRDEQQSEILLMELEIDGKSKMQNAEIQLAKAQLSNLKIKRQQLETSLSKIKGYFLNVENNTVVATTSHPTQDEKNYLATPTPTIRQAKKQPEITDNKVSILFLAADPTDASRLRLGEEYREISKQLKLAQLRDRFALESPQLSVRPSEITQALLETRSQIVHFSGHGTSTGELCFENETGQTLYVQPNALATLFKQFQNQVQCVLLNACYSEIQAKSIAEHIKFVIGMTSAIDDKAAIAFAIGFYQALGAGKTIEDSYQFGCVQILLQGIPGDKIPVLIQKENSFSQNAA